AITNTVAVVGIIATMWITIHQLEKAVVASAAEARQLRVGNAKPSLLAGVAGHFSAGVLDFSDAEDRKCKTLAEAEQLVKKSHKAWLADAYDWFVIPATLSAGDISPVKAAKPGKTRK
ncbi:MAG: hypothetical protein ABI790_15135, partial [Betaproteobacteria bacterium]